MKTLKLSLLGLAFAFGSLAWSSLPTPGAGLGSAQEDCTMSNRSSSCNGHADCARKKRNTQAHLSTIDAKGATDGSSHPQSGTN